MKLFCLIPAYNETGNLIPLTEGLVNIIPKFSPDYKIFFIIQGDNKSLKILKKLKRKYKNIDWVYYEKALGIGKAYKIGFEKVDGDYTHVLTLDADLNHDPAFIPDFINKMKNKKADLVIGSRFIKGGSFNDRRQWKKFISFIVNKIISRIVRLNIHDLSSGYRLIKRNVIENVRSELQETGYPNYMELIIKTARKNYSLSEVPIVYRARVWGKSKMGKIRTMYDYLKFLLRLSFT